MTTTMSNEKSFMKDLSVKRIFKCCNLIKVRPIIFPNQEEHNHFFIGFNNETKLENIVRIWDVKHMDCNLLTEGQVPKELYFWKMVSETGSAIGTPKVLSIDRILDEDANNMFFYMTTSNYYHPKVYLEPTEEGLFMMMRALTNICLSLREILVDLHVRYDQWKIRFSVKVNDVMLSMKRNFVVPSIFSFEHCFSHNDEWSDLQSYSSDFEDFIDKTALESVVEITNQLLRNSCQNVSPRYDLLQSAYSFTKEFPENSHFKLTRAQGLLSTIFNICESGSEFSQYFNDTQTIMKIYGINDLKFNNNGLDGLAGGAVENAMCNLLDEKVDGLLDQITRDSDTNDQDFRFSILQGNGFQDVIGMDDSKEYLKSIFMPVEIDDVARYYGYEDCDNKKLKGVLLHGPSGSGKSFLAKQLAIEMKLPCLEVDAKTIGSTLVHASSMKIRDLFQKAISVCAANGGCVLIFDEIDGFVPKKDMADSHKKNDEVDSFLTALQTCMNYPVYIIATTNRPDIIEPAILRSGRISNKLFVPLPSTADRSKIFKSAFSKAPLAADIDFDILAEKTRNFSARDIQELVVDRVLKTCIASGKKQEITFQMINEVVDSTHPSVNESDLKFYQDISKNYMTAQTDSYGHIGFQMK